MHLINDWTTRSNCVSQFDKCSCLQCLQWAILSPSPIMLHPTLRYLLWIFPDLFLSFWKCLKSWMTWDLIDIFFYLQWLNLQFPINTSHKGSVYNPPTFTVTERYTFSSTWTQISHQLHWRANQSCSGLIIWKSAHMSHPSIFVLPYPVIFQKHETLTP